MLTTSASVEPESIATGLTPSTISSISEAAITVASIELRPSSRPVDVLEVDPERELVDRQAEADAEEERAELGVGAAAVGDEAERPEGHHRDDPEDEVVEVDAALAFDVPRPPGDAFAADDPRAHPDEGEGAEEADEDQEDRLLVVLLEVAPEVGEDRRGRHRGAILGAAVRRPPRRRLVRCRLRLALERGKQPEIAAATGTGTLEGVEQGAALRCGERVAAIAAGDAVVRVLPVALDQRQAGGSSLEPRRPRLACLPSCLLNTR